MKIFVLLLLVTFSLTSPVWAVDVATVPETAVEAGAKTYTCLMHPEVVQPLPGQCPLCGMDLVEKAQTAEGEATAEAGATSAAAE